MRLTSCSRSVRAKDLPLLCPPRFDIRAALQDGRRPTPRECQPHRPRPRPRWAPSRQSARARLPTGCVEPISASLRAAPDLGHTRINFNYGNVFATSADLCDKPGRQQFCEGSGEILWRRWAIVNTNVVDFQFQPIEIEFEDEQGRRRIYTCDVAFELVDGMIVFAEIKAERVFFEMAETRILVEASAQALAPEGIVFARLLGTDFDAITSNTIKSLYDRSRAAYTEEELSTVLNAIRASVTSTISMREAADALGRASWQVDPKLCSMMADRRIAIDIALPITPDTRLRLVTEARKPGTLRAFLRRLAEAATCSPM